MDAFRWVLLIIGLVIFLLIFFFSKKKSASEVFRKDKISPVLGHKQGDGLVSDVDAVSLEDFAGDIQLDSKDMPARISVPESDSRAQTAVDLAGAKDAAAEKMIVLYLVEKHGGVLSGADIISSLEQVGMRYGDMKIFHYYSDLDSGNSPPLFSMANLIDPGWFDLISIDKIKTPGLTLFMQVPGPISSVRAFDEMLDVIEKLEQRLPVTLKDKSQNIVSKQMLMHMREELVEYDRIRTMQAKQ